MAEALAFLLDNQLVIPVVGPHALKCISGSGIGLLHSAAVANMYFYLKVEQPMRSSFRYLSVYSRYHDDIILCAYSTHTLRAFMRGFKCAAVDVFTVIVTQIASVNVPVNHLDLSITLRNNVLEVEPTLTKVPAPLCVTSSHHQCVHRAWPAAIANRVWTLSSPSKVQHNMQKLFANYEAGNVHPTSLEQMSEWKPSNWRRLSQPTSQVCDQTSRPAPRGPVSRSGHKLVPKRRPRGHPERGSTPVGCQFWSREPGSFEKGQVYAELQLYNAIRRSQLNC